MLDPVEAALADAGFGQAAVARMAFSASRGADVSARAAVTDAAGSTVLEGALDDAMPPRSRL